MSRVQNIQIHEYLFNVSFQKEEDGNDILSSNFSIPDRLTASLTEKELRKGQMYQQQLHAGGFNWLLLKEGKIELPTHDIVISVFDVQYSGESVRFGGGNISSENLKEVCEHCNDPACDFDCPDALEWATSRDYEDCQDNNEKLASNRHFNYACDAVLSMALAHAIAGIDIKSEAYLEGLETAIDAIGNNI